VRNTTVWEEEAITCPLCGAALGERTVRGRERKQCTSCSFVLYRNPASAALGVVLDEVGRVLLVRRTIEPFRGQWALPAGYQEVDEDPSTTVVREVAEETGILIEVLGLLDLVWIPEDPRKPANVAVFLCRSLGGSPRPGREESEVGWFALDALPHPLGFRNYERILARLRGDDGYPDSPWSLVRDLLGRCPDGPTP